METRVHATDRVLRFCLFFENVALFGVRTLAGVVFWGLR